MKPRYRGIAFVVLISFILLCFAGWNRTGRAQEKSVAAVKPDTSPVNISTPELIKLNGAIALQRDGFNRRERALQDLYNAMTDLGTAEKQINEVMGKLPKDVQAVQEDGRITGFVMAPKVTPKP